MYTHADTEEEREREMYMYIYIIYIHIICTCMHITFLYKLVTESIECSIRQKIIEI